MTDRRFQTSIDGATAWAGEWQRINVGSTKYSYCVVTTERDGYRLITQVEINSKGIEDGNHYGCVATRAVLDQVLKEAQARVAAKNDADCQGTD